ncbi:hypothetical protein BEWA_050330 [Theileria equi strain WA]|uniref:Uncharacterized protein n=1 Tax=Theileria equi strain WA TaxID=1537102 RepID=L1LBB6_THEEQ|nr:hypothetical protein BEWA_050330 [Theileria equi strain WA]EKX72565.1 hypothetical protein BEWA_050330 [Theileria equi strain WA]|eukprot:XP_004832017.1 hypothetical protein BEWA_050330 [Theileria equi strain WA]
MGGIELDIGQAKRDNPEGDIKVIKKDNNLQGYITYEYKGHNEKPFELTGLNYDSKRITTIVILSSIKNVNNVIICCDKGGKTVFIIGIGTTECHYYYTNSEADKNSDHSTKFEKFLVKGFSSLQNDDLNNIIYNIKINKTLDYDSLDIMLKNFLWRPNSVVFDLSKSADKSTYPSDVTDIQVSVGKGNMTDAKFLDVTHTPDISPFYIEDIKKSGKHISIDGGFPNDPLTGFSVYYKIDDKKYNDPLLVVLTLNNLGGTDQRFISSHYLISKNKNNSTWNIRRVVGTDTNENDIKAILSNIVLYNKLDFKYLNNLKGRLNDLTEGLLIDLTNDFREEKGQYTSEGKRIPYRKIKASAYYTTISHADTFTSFTISGIKVTNSDFINRNLFHTERRIYGLNIFYKGNSTADPLLIHILEDTLGTNKWISRHLGDTTWHKHEDSSPKSDTDIKDIQKLIEQLNTPNIIIDLSKPKEYTPTENTLEVEVKNIAVKGLSDCCGFEHTMSQNKAFTVKQFAYETSPLKAIKFPDQLLSVTAYYSGTSPNLVNLLMVKLEANNSGLKYIYFKRKNKDVSSWMQYNQDKNLDNNSLKIELERLMKEYGLESPQKSTGHFKPESKDAPGKSEGYSEDSRETDFSKEQEASSSISIPKSSDSSSGAIVGGIFGGIACLCLVGAAIWKVGPSVRTYLASRKRIL